ncbi:protein kinase [Photobacterium phosphoreum]|uniref:Protein kinase n=1 Tax=Photobacterium phosphoreum TaxID=659 RepID=A0AAW5A209_PHOPO|nr:protein kinase family protein [Photobacterium phosphoreum]MCD9491727.1 protein kinase [Photobacterium phosphoreum]MCF2191098.1 protein kinase [Photobacterium phosphoreum]MCF2302636.1 protein kinase [Photobacterium phosphoreum]
MDQCVNYFLNDKKELGRGSFGKVYKCEVYNLTKTHKKIFARKYFSLCPEFDNTQAKEIADLRQRFNVEIKTQCSLNSKNHKCIAPIVMFNTNGEHPYFVMELAEKSLLDAINDGMSEQEKQKAITSIINGVLTIHDNHYLHRDLNPKNILKYKDGTFKITDFGLVKDLNTLRAEIKTKFVGGMGTDGYMAPEVNDNGIFSVQSDIYSIGKIISRIYPKPTQKIRTIISKCHAYFPEDRYKNAAELMDEYLLAINVKEIAHV